MRREAGFINPRVAAGAAQASAEAAAPHVLDDLTDVDTSTTAPTDGQGLVFHAASGLWIPASIAISLGLDGLTDVDTTTTAPTDGQVLKYHAASGLWIPAADAGGATNLDGLSDVDTTTTAPTDGQVLKYHAATGQWLPAAAGAATHPSLMAHRYWIVHFTGTRDFAATVAELEFRATPGGADQCAGGTAIAFAVGSGSAAANAFDNNPATFWFDNTVSTSGPAYLPTWIGYDFGAGNSKVVQELAISARNDTAADQTPLFARLMYSDDGTTYFTAYEWNFASFFTLGLTRAVKNPLA